MVNFLSFIFSLLAFCFSLYGLWEVKGNKNKESSLPTLNKHPSGQGQLSPSGSTPIQSSTLTPLSPLKKKGNGEKFVGKNVLSIIATVMIAIGSVCLGLLAGDVLQVILLFAAGLGMGAFGFLGKESTFRTSLLACGEVITFIAIIMTGAVYSLISVETTLLLVLLFAVFCCFIMLKKTHPIFSFSANAGLLIAVIYVISSGFDVRAAVILTVVSFIASLLAKKDRCAINFIMSNIMLYGISEALESEPIYLIIFALIQIAEFSYFKTCNVKPLIQALHIALWSACNILILDNYAWEAYVKNEFIFKSNDALLYTGVSLALACVAMKVTSLLRGKDNKLADLGLLFSLWTPICFRFLFEEGFPWHITETPFNYFALILLGIPGLCLVWGLAKDRNKVYSIIGISFFMLLAWLVPYSEYGGNWFEKGLWIGETGALIWAIVCVLGFAVINFYLHYEKEDNKVAILLSIIGAYLSVYMSGSVNFILITATITLAVSVMQYYSWNFRLDVYIVSHLFDFVILAAFTSGALSEVAAVTLFILAQSSSFFTVKKAMETNRAFLWISTLLRTNLYVIFLSGNFDVDFGFVLSGILLAIAAVLICLGFKFDIKVVRTFGLWQLIAIVIKMCLIDVGGSNPIIRIVAFIGGGLLCLGVSALYGKYDKKIQ